MILIPSHPCLPDDPARPAPVAYGELDPRNNVATCSLRVRWGIHPGQHERLPGCGARIAVCHGCGLRTRINGARCETCGGEERPEVMTHDGGGVQANEAAPLDSDRSGPSVAIVANAPDARQGDAGQREAGARRETKEKAPSKPRAPRKTVKKGAAAPDDPGLPLFK